MNQEAIGEIISIIRKQRGLSQAELAELIGISRSALAQLELGNRNMTVPELITFCHHVRITADQFLTTPRKGIEYQTIELPPSMVMESSERVSDPSLNLAKMKNVLLYILEKTAGKPNVGETVLNKLFYFSDFDYFELYEEFLTGAEYRKLPYGPVPQELDTILIKMEEDGEIKTVKTRYHGYLQKRYIPLVSPNLKELKASEIHVIDQVIHKLGDYNASDISDYSHKDLPWLASDESEIIHYELAFYREKPYSVRRYEAEHDV